MLEIRPFSAIRFDHQKLGGDLSPVIAPPYDVLNATDKARLMGKSERNIIAIDLPHVPPKTAGPAECYVRSASLLAQWLGEGTLVRETAPAMYAYHQQFRHEGKAYIRRMFIARVRLMDFSAGVVLPHEQTFGGPKEDRLALMKATKCQLSPILGMYTDPQDQIGTALAPVVENSPSATGNLNDVLNKIWIVDVPNIIDTITTKMADKKVYIADGHHRYGTALLYRDWLARENGGSLPNDHAANYIMFVLAAMDDPGCLILPYNRVVASADLEAVASAWAPGAQPCAADEADVVLFDGTSGAEQPMRFTNRAALKSLEPNECAPWYDLDYAYLHRYLIDELLTTKLGARPNILYAKSRDAAIAKAKSESGVGLLMKATPMAHLRAVSEAGGLMPQKSTYFHPKLATGLVMNPLA